MSIRNFSELVENQWTAGKFLSIGLDPDAAKLPAGQDILSFSKEIVDATGHIAAAYKVQSAFYEAEGVAGMQALEEIIRYIQEKFPEVPVILDAKRGDIGNTSEAYAQAVFDHLKADAVTLNPYMGQDSLQPFLERADKGCIILCRTSNPGGGEFQELEVDHQGMSVPLYLHVAQQVAEKWNTQKNCWLVVGAAHPDEMASIRQSVRELPFLVPGIGAQGGDLEKTLAAGFDAQKKGLLIHASRSVIFAENPREEAEKLHQAITKYRQS